jgi:transposase
LCRTKIDQGVQSTCLVIKQGAEVITMDMLGKVRRMKMRDKLSISEIAKRTGLARNTIRSWLLAPGDVIPKYERRTDPHKLTEYEPSLILALKADRLRHKDSRRTGRALFIQITAQGYRGGYTQVTDFIRAWREEAGNPSSTPNRVFASFPKI